MSIKYEFSKHFPNKQFFVSKSPAILFRVLPISPAIFLVTFVTSPAILHGFCVICGCLPGLTGQVV